jgi:hypothetical protein
MVRRGIRAIGGAPSAVANRLFDEWFGDWQPESFRKAVEHLPAAEEQRWLLIAREYGKKFLSRSMSKRAKKPRPARSGKYADRNRWIRAQYAGWKNRNPNSPFSHFCANLEKGLASGRIKIARDVQPQLYPNGQLLSEDRLRQIIDPR